MPLTDEDRDELTAYLDGEADAATRARIETRLNRDPEWRAEADTLRQAWEMLDQLPKPEPSPTFTSRTLDRLAAVRPPASGPTTTIYLPHPPRVPARWWAYAAVIATGLGIGWAATGWLTQPAVVKPDDPQLIRELRLVDNLPQYQAVETMDYLHALDERFGEGAGP